MTRPRGFIFFIVSLFSTIEHRHADIDTQVARLAPSPTGCLHLGNARSFLLAWLQGRRLGGRVILRIEDLDQPRAVDGADRDIVEDLRWLGLDWDNELTPEYYQSNRYDLYREGLARLEEMGLIYPCYCSRKELRAAMSAPHGREGIYPGTCRRLSHEERTARSGEKDPALRLRVEPGVTITFDDLLNGRQQVDLAADTGDFIVARADGIPSYHLAVVLDDIAMGVTQVLRGDDLLDSTPRQAHLIDLLGGTRPTWTHVPLLLDEEGRRLAKRFGATPIGALRRRGVPPEELVGRLAADCGLIERPEPVTPSDLIPLFDPSGLRRDPSTTTDLDPDRMLRGIDTDE